MVHFVGGFGGGYEGCDWAEEEEGELHCCLGLMG